MEDLCTGITTQNLPLVGHPDGDCFFIHLYPERGRTKMAHSLWHKGKLELIVLDSWLWHFVSIHRLSHLKWPTPTCDLMPVFGEMAFTHMLNALSSEDFGELNVAVQTQYAMQIINGASHLPIHHGVYSRVYSAKPFILELKA